MKITAFRCEICGAVGDGNAHSGMRTDMQGEIFDGKTDIKFTLEPNSDKSEYHFCMDCYTRQVDEPAQSIKRNNNQDEYTTNYEALQRNFFLLLYRRYEVNRRNSVAKGERIIHNKNRNKRRR